VIVVEGPARKRPAAVYTKLSAKQVIAGAFIAEIANYVQSRGPNLKVRASITSGGAGQALHFSRLSEFC
jgi:hypothetical protein